MQALWLLFRSSPRPDFGVRISPAKSEITSNLKDSPYSKKDKASEGRNRHLKGHGLAYNDLKDRVLIKTHLKGSAFRADTRHKACRWNSRSWTEIQKNLMGDLQRGICNEHLGHEEDNEAKLFG